MAKKNITLNQLAEKMDKGFTAVDRKIVGIHEKMDKGFTATDKKVDKKIDDLGIMVKNGFDEVHQKMDKRFGNVDKRLDELKRDMDEVKLKFAYTAWAIDVEELKKRVFILEQKLGVKKL